MSRRYPLLLAASALVAGAAISACGSSPTPEKDATLTFGCFIGECVPAAADASDDASESVEASADASDASDD